MGLMQIPRRVDYGLRAVIYLSGQEPDRCCSIGKISREQGVPRKFLEKIIQDLVHGGLIRSRRGSTGGYQLARAPEAISFCDVIEALEGPIAVNACMEHQLGCDQIPRCRMIGVWSEVQHKVMEVLSRTTIAALKHSPCEELIVPSSLSSAA